MPLSSSSSSQPWRIIPRPLLETVLHNYAHHDRVPHLLLLHGPRGTGKSSLLLHRLLPSWSQPPHFTAFVNFQQQPSWSLSPSSPFPPLPSLTSHLELQLESLLHSAILLGAVSPRNIFHALQKWHGIRTPLQRLTGQHTTTTQSPSSRASDFKLFSKAVSSRMMMMIGGSGEEEEKQLSKEERAYVKEAMAALRVAKEVIEMQREWRKEAVRRMNANGGVSRSLANSATDWVYLLVELISEAAEVDFFQPKLVINNIDVLRKATATDDSAVPAGMYHDSFIGRLITLGVNEKCLPVILATSDSYYSYQAFNDFGYNNVFISREMFGWTLQEAKLHMVSEFFSETEWKVIEEVLGSNPRHLSELYALKQSTHYQETLQSRSNFEDIVDAYLAYLQVTVVSPAMESVLAILQKFASDVHNGKIPEGQLPFGAPWRHPPGTDDPAALFKWAKIQLMDFVQSLVKAEFGINYIVDNSFEILEDPAAVSMMEVGLLYSQRDPSFIRPITRGIQRCLARWLAQERMQMSFGDSILYLWQRIMRGRSYRHLMIK